MRQLRFKTWMETQQIHQQPQVQSAEPRPPQPGQVSWPPAKTEDEGKAVGPVPQIGRNALASQNTQQKAKQNLQGQQDMQPQTQGPGWRPASGAEGGAQQLASRP